MTPLKGGDLLVRAVAAAARHGSGRAADDGAAMALTGASGRRSPLGLGVDATFTGWLVGDRPLATPCRGFGSCHFQRVAGTFWAGRS